MCVFRNSICGTFIQVRVMFISTLLLFRGAIGGRTKTQPSTWIYFDRKAEGNVSSVTSMDNYSQIMDIMKKDANYPSCSPLGMHDLAEQIRNLQITFVVGNRGRDFGAGVGEILDSLPPDIRRQIVESRQEGKEPQIFELLRELSASEKEQSLALVESEQEGITPTEDEKPYDFLNRVIDYALGGGDSRAGLNNATIVMSTL